MKDKKFIPFWMEKPKIEIIEAYAECIHNGEVLLERIEKAVEYIKENIIDIDFVKENYDINTFYDFEISIENVIDLLNILNGEEKENE